MLASTLSLEFNVEKSHCIAIGKMCNKELTPMSLGFNSIQWCEAIKYFGVYLQGGRSLKFDINPTMLATQFLHSSGINELTVLHLQETYSLSDYVCYPCTETYYKTGR